MKAFDYAVAKNEAGVFEALGKGYRIKAGGIDVVDLLKERIVASDKLVSIHRLDGLRGIREKDGAIEIGASTTLEEIADSAVLAKSAPVLGASIRNAATPQIRAVATAAGNLCQRPRCWYFRSQEHECLKKGGARCFAADGENSLHALFGNGPCHIVHPSNLAGALIAADGEIVIRGEAGEKIVKAAEFFAMPDKSIYAENILGEKELIVALRIPSAVAKSAYVDIKEKQSFDWPLASASVALRATGWRVVLGAVAPIPWIATKAEEVLVGAEEITPALAEKAADAALEGAKPMSQNSWRLKLVRAAVRRALLLADGKEID